MKKSFLTTASLAILFTTIISISCTKNADTPKAEEGSVFNPPPAVSNDSLQFVSTTNSDFEAGYANWKVENDRRFVSGDTTWGIRIRQEAGGNHFLNFYAPQSYHTDPLKPNWKAPDWTPWNGSALQTLANLADGEYILQCQAGSAGVGMYLWANGGNGADSTTLAKDFTTTSIKVSVKGGTLLYGVKCVNADAPNKEENAPWFNVDYFTIAMVKK